MGEETRELPFFLYRHRGYVGSDLESPDLKNRLLSELDGARRGEVWFSPVSDQNDPFDTHPVFLDESSYDLNRAIKTFQKTHGKNTKLNGQSVMDDSKLTNGLPSTRRDEYWGLVKAKTLPYLMDVRNKSFVCCFTETSKSILMWSYYSSSHKAFCYEFQRNGEQHEGFPLWFGMKYIESRPRLKASDFIKFSSFRLQFYPVKDSAMAGKKSTEALRSLLTGEKATVWSHEHEWRVFSHVKQAGYSLIPPYSLRRIVLGVNADTALERFIRDHAGDVAVVRASLHQERYEIVVPSAS